MQQPVYNDERNVIIMNQLDAQTLKVEEPKLLCEPSKTLGLELLCLSGGGQGRFGSWLPVACKPLRLRHLLEYSQ